VRRAFLATLAVSAAIAAPAASAADWTSARLGSAARGAPLLAQDRGGGELVAWAGSTGARGAIQAVFRGRGAQVFTAPAPVNPEPTDVRSFAVAAGPGGDAIVLWREDTRGAPLRASIFRIGDRPGFVRTVGVPGSAGERGAQLAIDGRGNTIVVWTVPGRAGCGAHVVASFGWAGGVFARPVRVGGTCDHAALPQVAVSDGGSGVVAWRTGFNRGYAKSTYGLSAARVTTRPHVVGTAHELSSHVAGVSAAVVAARGRGLVAWRDAASTTRAGTRGCVVAEPLTAGGSPTRPEAVSVSDVVQGVPAARITPEGRIVVAWHERTSPSAANLLASADLGLPQLVDAVNYDTSRGAPALDLDAGGLARLAWQTPAGHLRTTTLSDRGTLGINEDLATQVRGEPRVAVDGAGRSLVIWLTGDSVFAAVR
jgi:hypothetical protein